MKEFKIDECPKIRYHITYYENLTLKDLEDLINLIRVSTNDALQGIGVSRSKGNDLQRIDKVQPGSIDIVTAVGFISSVITIGGFVRDVINLISKKTEEEHNKDLRGTRKDKKVYNRNKVTVSNSECGDIYIDNSTTVHIHVHNEEDVKNILKHL